MSFVEDFTPYFVDFGQVVYFGATPVEAIFDNAYATALGFTAGTAPMLIVRAADVTSVAPGNSVTVASTSYTVTAIEPDGTGLVLLRLQEA